MCTEGAIRPTGFQSGNALKLWLRGLCQVGKRGNPDDLKVEGCTLLYHGPIGDKECSTRTWEHYLCGFWIQMMFVETILFVSTASAARVDLANSTSQQGHSLVSRSWHLSRRPGRRCLDVQRPHQPEQHGRATCALIARLPLLSPRSWHGLSAVATSLSGPDQRSS